MTVHYTISDRIATVTLNRPHKLNALNYEMIGALHKVLDECETRADVGAIILTGAGPKAFSAGADIADLAGSIAQGRAAALREVIGRGHALTRRIENYPKPIIGAINGMALGGGCELTEATHIAIAAEHASFGKPEITLGFPPPFGGSQRLPRHVGRKHALEMILTGDSIDAETALKRGLINEVVAADVLLDKCHELAARILRHAPSAIAACLAAVTRGINLPIDEGLAVEAAWFATTVETEAVRDSLDRFLTTGRARIA
jgi:enoyl-CoA hydratase